VTTPLLSAIVSTYAAERFIRGCIEDLVTQTIADQMEIIVIDAYSPEGEGEIVRELAARHPNIRYTRTSSRETVYQSWNRGIRMATGKYVTNANADDRHRTDGLQVLVGALESDPGAALAYGDVAITFRENQTFEEASRVLSYRWPDFDRRHLFRASFIGPQPVWRRNLHDRYGWFDPEFRSSGDYEFWLRLATQERFIHIPEVIGLYLASPGSVEHQNLQLTFEEGERARTRYWQPEWGPRPSPGGSFLRVHPSVIARRIARGDAGPVREVIQQLRMLVGDRIRRRSS
jgi:glycosyltransferase involved in cell wall biosynthesis